MPQITKQIHNSTGEPITKEIVKWPGHHVDAVDAVAVDAIRRLTE